MLVDVFVGSLRIDVCRDERVTSTEHLFTLVIPNLQNSIAEEFLEKLKLRQPMSDGTLATIILDSNALQWIEDKSFLAEAQAEADGDEFIGGGTCQKKDTLGSNGVHYSKICETVEDRCIPQPQIQVR